jgi:hypothetical protein
VLINLILALALALVLSSRIFAKEAIDFDFQREKAQQGCFQKSLEMLGEDLIVMLPAFALPVPLRPRIIEREKVLNQLQ